MMAPTFDGFVGELRKIAGKGIGELLGQKAMRAGMDPSKIPAIQQATNLAEQGNRGRAAQIARNVSGFLKQQRV